jgi:hypothetical protein
VQQAREAARRTECKNKLKQLVLAAHNFHDVNKKFPYNYYVGGNNWRPDSRSWSWIANLLPYIEQKGLYDQIRLGGTTAPRIPNDTVNGVRIRDNVLTAVRCPSDIAPEMSINAADSFGANTAVTSYKGVTGSNWNGGGFNISNPGGSNDGLERGNGIFDRSMDRRNNGSDFFTTNPTDALENFTAIRDVTDGTSNTFMIGESSNHFSQWAGFWGISNHTVSTCAIPPNYKQPNGTLWGRGDWPRNYSFHSFHPGGVQFAMGDGAVVFVNDNINIAIYRGLATKQGGETVQLP